MYLLMKYIYLLRPWPPLKEAPGAQASMTCTELPSRPMESKSSSLGSGRELWNMLYRDGEIEDEGM